jgi:hypothetical protein
MRRGHGPATLAATMRRAARALVASLLLVALAAPAGAAEVTTIKAGAVGGGFSRSGDGPWLATFNCRTGVDGALEFRFALEFPLAALPAGAIVTAATLAIRTDDHEWAGQTAVRGYAGDGAITADDVTVNGTPVTFTPGTSDERVSVDVTSLVTAGVVASGWAGLSLRQQPPGSGEARWRCPGDGSDPKLTLEYEVAVVPATREDCLQGGWRDLTRANGTPFGNQGACVSYVTRQG